MQTFETDAAKIPQRIAFEDARLNLFSSAQHGVDARLTWLDGQRLNARDLLLQRLIPAARDGLEALQVPGSDIDYYLGIIEARTISGRSGARWLLDSLENVSVEERASLCREAVKIMRDRQGCAIPVHDWELVVPDNGADAMPDKKRVSDVMTTDLFTVRPEDLLDLATSTMEWRHVRHVPVESAAGELVGLLSTRELLGLHSGEAETAGGTIAVSTVMRRDPLTISPDATLEQAFTRILESDTGCLLVVARGQLLGIVTERDLLEVAVTLISND